MIDLPFPAPILWPNGRGHHMKKHREFQKHKGWATLAMHAELCSGFKYPGDRLRLIATFYPKTRNAIDKDNASGSLKAYQDGIASAMGVNDSQFEEPRILFGEPVKHGRVTIVIEGAE